MRVNDFGYPKSDTLDYFRKLQFNEYHRKYGWNLFEDFAEEHSGLQDRLREIKRFTNVTELHEYEKEVLKNQWKLMGRLAYDLWTDMHDCISERLYDILQTVVIGFIPIGITNAFCLNSDFNNQKLSGYIIGLNAGLLYCTELLSQSIIVENLTGELINLKRSGDIFFKNATNLYLNPTIDNLHNRNDFIKDIAELYRPEVSSYVGALNAIMLTFIALHEFGHIIYGHLDKNIGVRTFNITTGDLEYYLNKEQPKEHWQYEFQADIFAIDALCHRSKSNDVAWNNFFSIYLFFKWLDNIERVLKKKCLYHPPAKLRANYLYTRMKEQLGEPIHDYTNWVDQKTKEWSNIS